MTPHELRALILERGEEIVKEYINAALGDGEFSSTSVVAREAIWELLADMIRKADSPLSADGLDVGDTDAILKSIADGTITMEDGDKLISILKAVTDIENPTTGAGAPALTVIIEAGDGDKNIRTITNRTLEHDED